MNSITDWNKVMMALTPFLTTSVVASGSNLALKNNVRRENHVRVIHNCESMDEKCKKYVYDGRIEFKHVGRI